MRDYLKIFYSFVIEFFQGFVSFFAVVCFNKIGVNRCIRKCSKERNGIAASILANGPSASDILNNRMDLLCSTDILAMNDFANTDAFFLLKPKYYILFDYAYFNHDYRLETEIEDEIDIKPEFLVIDNLMKVDWDMCLFVCYSKAERKVREKLTKNPHVKVVECHGTRIMGYQWFQNLMYRYNQGVPCVNNVIIPAMLVLANIGYKTIYLYGAELSWTKTMDVDLNNGKMFFNNQHFFDDGKTRYFDKGGYRWWLEAIAKMLKGTESVAKYAESKGVRIINRTKGSFIDAFEYENPDTIKMKS